MQLLTTFTRKLREVKIVIIILSISSIRINMVVVKKYCFT